ncbi:hypothetical protein KCMC57_up29260 [Kitasatospora sp. CMC57]|uniref:CBM6 domain-containing protein n=1 Tax=Kitasatospora sp. CMC57 TaxID=3231513 RepID=A0AB33JTL0_9ACTN
MTTAGSNGAPEDAAQDDPFAYLYRPAEGEQAASQPRDSYSRPVEVGRAQYGQQAARPPRAPLPPMEPTAQLPQQHTRYAEHSRPQPGEQQPAGRSKGVVIGAVAVVAAIAIGAGVALSMGDPNKPADKAAGSTAAPVVSPSASPSPSASATPTASTDPIADASKLQGQNAPSGNSVKGAKSADGGYLTLTNGSSVSWTVSVPTAGTYKFWLHFNNTGQNLKGSVTVNGKPRDGGISLNNYSGTGVDPASAWYSTNIWPELQAGANTITVSVPAGGSDSILVDQVALTPMSVNSYPGS